MRIWNLQFDDFDSLTSGKSTIFYKATTQTSYDREIVSSARSTVILEMPYEGGVVRTTVWAYLEVGKDPEWSPRSEGESDEAVVEFFTSCPMDRRKELAKALSNCDMAWIKDRLGGGVHLVPLVDG